MIGLLISPEFEGIKTPGPELQAEQQRLLISPEFEGIKTCRFVRGGASPRAY